VPVLRHTTWNITYSLNDDNADVLVQVDANTGAFEKAIPLLVELVSQEPGWTDGPTLLALTRQAVPLLEAIPVKARRDSAPKDARPVILRHAQGDQWDLALVKNTRIGRTNLQFRIEGFNILNRANFGFMTSSVRSSAV
jgi:hypothetical protein